MEALITGAGGFVGGHLLNYLKSTVQGIILHGTLFSETERRPGGCTLHVLDLRDPVAVRALLAKVRPTRIFHLAGQAYVPQSFIDPWDTLEHNIRGTLNLLQAVHELALNQTRVLVVSSAEIYGAVPPSDLPLTEDAPFQPSSPYSVSKIAQDMLALQYAGTYHLHIVRVRPFNHIGPGQNARFAVPDWASQIAQAEAGQREPVVYVGNLEAARDFTDVRDVVRAYALALEYGVPGEVYNVCSGKAHTMQTILDTLVSLSTMPIKVQVVPERVRPIDIPILYGSAERLRSRTGWQPQLEIRQSLSDVLHEWRQHARAQPASAS